VVEIRQEARGMPLVPVLLPLHCNLVRRRGQETLQETKGVQDQLEEIDEEPAPRMFWPRDVWSKYGKKLEVRFLFPCLRSFGLMSYWCLTDDFSFQRMPLIRDCQRDVDPLLSACCSRRVESQHIEKLPCTVSSDGCASSLRHFEDLPRACGLCNSTEAWQLATSRILPYH
jgi:hypothetical protein